MVYLMPAAAKSLQLYLILCDPIDGSSPGSPIPWILQARILEWVDIAFSMVYLMDKAFFFFYLDSLPLVMN